MNSLGAGAFGSLQQFFRNQVAVPGRRGSYCNGFIGKAYVPCVDISLRINRDRPDAQPVRRMDNAAGDFTAVGYEKLIEH